MSVWCVARSAGAAGRDSVAIYPSISLNWPTRVRRGCWQAPVHVFERWNLWHVCVVRWCNVWFCCKNKESDPWWRGLGPGFVVRGATSWCHLRWERREIRRTMLLFFWSHWNRRVLSEMQAPPHLLKKKKTWSGETTQAPPVIAQPKGLRRRLPLHTIMKRFFLLLLQ